MTFTKMLSVVSWTKPDTDTVFVSSKIKEYPFEDLIMLVGINLAKKFGDRDDVTKLVEDVTSSGQFVDNDFIITVSGDQVNGYKVVMPACSIFVMTL